MKNVKTLLIFIITISTVVFASSTRTGVLGGSGFWADDYSNITAFPAAVNDHNVAYTSGNNFATIFDHGGNKWGFAGGNDVNEVVNMNWGNGTYGVRLGVAMKPDDAATTGVDEAETGYDVGFGMPLAGMDFGLGYNDSGTINLNLRRAQDIWAWENLLVGFWMTPEEKTAGAITTRENMALNIDCYSNRSYGDGTSGLFGLGFHYGAMGAEATGGTAPDATMNLVWNFAVESEMTDWATLRMGYATMWDAGGGANSAGVLVGGLGFNYDSFNLDMNVDVPSLVHDPVVYMTGRNIGTPLGTTWTITYSW